MNKKVKIVTLKNKDKKKVKFLEYNRPVNKSLVGNDDVFCGEFTVTDVKVLVLLLAP